MKKLVIFSVLAVVVLCFATCGNKKEDQKSAECNILNFLSNPMPSSGNWTIGENTVDGHFAKKDNLTNVSVNFTISNKATSEPKTGSTLDLASGSKTIVVTAEDGKTQKTYTVTATKATE